MRRRPLTLWRLINIALTVLGLIALLIYWISGGFNDKPRTATIRVNVAGYLADSSKHAVLMAGESLAGETFDIVASSGRTVLSKTISEPSGGWNQEFSSVHLIDFSELTTVGTYRIVLDDADSPQFRIDSGANLYTARVTDALDGYFATQRDTAHRSDTVATVYTAPRFSGTGLAEPLTPDPQFNAVDVSGGWYDSFGYTKLTHSATYAAVCLALAVRDADLPQLREELQYGLSWLRKLWNPATGVLFAQVGLFDGGDTPAVGDRQVWRQPEADEALRVGPGDERYYLKHRPVFAANEPGQAVPANLAGRYAAAFALAAAREPDPTVARANLEQAASIYARANPDVNAVATSYPAELFSDASGADDMELAAAALTLAANALGDERAPEWRADAQRFAALATPTLGAPHLGNVTLLAHLLAAEIVDDPNPLRTSVSTTLDAATTASRDHMFGLATGEGAIADATGLAFAAEWFADTVEAPKVRQLAAGQWGYVLGINPWGVSFLMADEATSPRCPHHERGNLTGRMQLLHGGLVGLSPGRSGESYVDQPDGIRACDSERYRYDAPGVSYRDAATFASSNTPTLDQSALALAVTARLAGRT